MSGLFSCANLLEGCKKKHFTNFIDFNFIDIDKNDIETWEKPKSKEKIELKFAV